MCQCMLGLSICVTIVNGKTPLAVFEEQYVRLGQIFLQMTFWWPCKKNLARIQILFCGEALIVCRVLSRKNYYNERISVFVCSCSSASSHACSEPRFTCCGCVSTGLEAWGLLICTSLTGKHILLAKMRIFFNHFCPREFDACRTSWPGSWAVRFVWQC